MISVEDCRSPITRAEALERVLELFQGLGFDTTGWQEGRIQRTIMTVFATLLADGSEVDRLIANGTFSEYAEGILLELYSHSRYRNYKTPAVATSGLLSLTNSSTTAYTIQPGGLLAATRNGVEFRMGSSTPANVAAGTPGSPVTTQVRFTAVIKGASGNVGTGEISVLKTPLAGVTVNNPGDPWYDVVGVDLESDDSLRQRNATKWSTLSVERIAAAYENIAREAGASKVKVHADNPRGAGTIDVYVAAATAKLSASQILAIQQTMATHAFQTSATWPADSDSRVSVKHPTTQAPAISGTLYHDPGVAGSVILERARTALLDFLARTPIGGWDYSPGPANVIMYSDLIDVLKDVEGVTTVNLTAPTGNISIGALTLVIEGNWTGLVAVPQIST